MALKVDLRLLIQVSIHQETALLVDLPLDAFIKIKLVSGDTGHDYTVAIADISASWIVKL